MMGRLIHTVLLGALLLCGCSKIVDLEADLRSGEESAFVWMDVIPDDTPLTDISIPGAHDAASASITRLTLWTRTQELSVGSLWNAGVRAFDLRPAYVDGEMGIYHDKYSANVTMGAVLDVLVSALARDPSECAVLIIRHEEEADGNSAEWPSAFGALLDGYSDRLVPWHDGITLGELRGKMLVLSRTQYTGGPHGAYLTGWSHSRDLSSQKGGSVAGPDGNASPLWVQDYYDPANTSEKWDAVRGLLEASSEGPLVINHTSGYLGTLPDYRSNARDVNSKSADWLSSHDTNAGIILMDFAGVDKSNGVAVHGRTLLRAVVGNN